MSVQSEVNAWTSAQRAQVLLRQPAYPAAFIGLLLGWALIALPWLMGRVVIPYDAVAYFYQQLQFLAQALHSGDSPFWTPHVFGGSPQIADPQSLIFSPAILLAYFNPAPSLRTFDAYVFAVILAGCASVIAIFKDRGWHPAGAVVAAIAFGFGASASQRIQHVTQVQALMLFVTALWLLSRALDRRSLGYGLLAGIATALMIMEPGQIQLLGCYFLAGYVLNYWISSDKPGQALLQSIAPLSVAALTVLALATIPILLTFLFGMSSNRPYVGFEEAARGSLHPASLLTAFIADLFGANDAAINYWGPSNGEWTENSMLSQNMGQVYLGALPMLAFLVACMSGKTLWRKEIRFFTVALIFSVLYALGAYTPVFDVLYKVLPGVDLFRRPADATFFVGAFLALLGGYGLHLWLAGERGNTKMRHLGIAAAVFAFAFGLGVFFAVRQGHFSEAIKPLLVSGAYTLCAFGLVVAARRMKDLPPGVLVLAVAGFMAADLGWNNGPTESTALPAKDFTAIAPGSTDEMIAFLKANTLPALPTDRRDRVELVGIGFDWPNTGQTHGYDHTLGYNPLRLSQVDQALGAGDDIAVPQQRFFPPLFPSYHSRLADLFGLRYIVCPIPIEQIDTALKPGDLTLVKSAPDEFIYENKGALPRVLFASKWRVADFGSLIKTGQWPDFDPGETVLLEHAPRLPQSNPSGARPESSTARLITYRNTTVVVEVDAQSSGLLLLNDVWHPWWFAEVDGREAPILKANVLFRAVAVPAGRHQVRFSFRPMQGALRELRSRYGRG